jgi:hypothetical protein
MESAIDSFYYYIQYSSHGDICNWYNDVVQEVGLLNTNCCCWISTDNKTTDVAAGDWPWNECSTQCFDLLCWATIRPAGTRLTLLVRNGLIGNPDDGRQFTTVLLLLQSCIDCGSHASLLRRRSKAASCSTVHLAKLSQERSLSSGIFSWRYWKQSISHYLILASSIPVMWHCLLCRAVDLFVPCLNWNHLSLPAIHKGKETKRSWHAQPMPRRECPPPSLS